MELSGRRRCADRAVRVVRRTAVVLNGQHTPVSAASPLALFTGPSVLATTIGGVELQFWRVDGDSVAATPLAVVGSGTGSALTSIAYCPASSHLGLGDASGGISILNVDCSGASAGTVGVTTVVGVEVVHATPVRLIAAVEPAGRWLSVAESGLELTLLAVDGSELGPVLSVTMQTPPPSVHDPAAPMLATYDATTSRLLLSARCPPSH